MNKLKFKGWKLAKGEHQKGLFSHVINDDGIILNFNGIKFADLHFTNMSEELVPDSFYIVNYELEAENSKTFVVFGWYDAEGEILVKGYADNGERILAPENARTLEIAVNTYSTEKGRVEFKNLSVEYAGKYEEKNVTMAAIAIEYDKPAAKPEVNLERTLNAIDRVCASNKADIIVLTETFYDRCCFLDFRACSYPEDCDIVDKIKEKAKKYGTYICFSFHEIEEEVYYNTAFLIDRNGKTVGKYRKTHLTMSGYEGGMAPGNEIITFDTELGRIGIAICWDLFFPGFALEMFKRKVDIICHPTAGANMTRFSQRAIDCGAYILASTPSFSNTSIISPDGEVLALAEDNEGCAVVTVDMNKPEYKFWQSYPAYTEARDVYRSEARWDLYN